MINWQYTYTVKHAKLPTMQKILHIFVVLENTHIFVKKLEETDTFMCFKYIEQKYSTFLFIFLLPFAFVWNSFRFWWGLVKFDFELQIFDSFFYSP